MSEVDEFLAIALPRQREAETAIHNGDSTPRKEFWSHRDPVTVLGAARSASGWPEVERLFDWLASNFSNGESSRFDIIAAGASGDLAYLVGFEHTRVSVAGGAPVSYELRVTLVFRREGGEWKAVHRHADPMPDSLDAIKQLERGRVE